MTHTIAPQQLVLIYNADSSTLRALWDMAHKMLSPATYACHLCALTHGNFGEKDKWRAFRERFQEKLVMLHRDEFRQAYPDIAIRTPCVLRAENDGSFTTLMNDSDIDNYRQVDDIILQLEEIVTRNQSPQNKTH